VVTIHDIAVLEHPEWFSKAYAAVYRFLVPQLVKRAKCIITVSKHTKERLIKLLGAAENKINVVPNGISDHFTRRPVCESIRVQELLELPKGPYFLTVGSLEPRKNLVTLLAAWRSLGKRVGHANLIVAGAKGKLSVFSSSELGPLPDRVFFTGYIKEEHLAALYSGALALIYPSLYEGFGLPVLEASACGTCVITSNLTATAEIAGPSTILVDPYSEASIAKAIEKTLTHVPQPRLMQMGEEYARQFTWDRSAKLTEQVLLSCC
jgi:glycosyltransferase involved in cell wall biosynthesis